MRTPSLHPVREVLLAVPVFVKVLGIALGMLVLLGAGMLWQIHRTWHDHLRQDLEQRGVRFARDVGGHCTELSLAGQASEIPNELRHSVSEAPDVSYAILQDVDGKVLVEARAAAPASASAGTLEVTSLMGGGAHQLRVGMSTAGVDHEVSWLTRRLARTTAVIAFLGMLGAWWLTRLFAHPIQELVALTRTVQAGNYAAKAPVRARDEVGELAVAFNEMTTAIAHKEAARQQLLREVIRATEDERKRIARELHDQTGQSLACQIAALGALEGQTPSASARQRLAELREQTEQTLAAVHDLAVALRPSVLDDVGLVAALQRHCRWITQRSKVHVHCTEVGLDGRRLPPEVELTLYRVVQEAVTNAVRHGQARRVQTTLHLTPAGILATVRDDGRGFEPHDWRRRCLEGNHLGLLGLEERLALLGGSFRVESRPGEGTAIHANVPLKQTACPASAS